MSSGEVSQNKQRNPQHTMARVSTGDNGEIDYEEMPNPIKRQFGRDFGIVSVEIRFSEQ